MLCEHGVQIAPRTFHAWASRSLWDAAITEVILLVVILAAYALLELVEGIGLWLLQRWGEYFAVVATAIFLPLEVHELTKGITPTRAVTFAINVAAVIYLLVSKRLFGLRGGRKAYDEERRAEQLLDIERAATSR